MTQSQHYAGVSFDVGQRLSNAERNRLRNIARESGVWSYVEPANLTPTWVGNKLVSKRYEQDCIYIILKR